MPVRVVCPKCDFLLERDKGESPPAHCPSCGSRIACPRCGAALPADSPGVTTPARCAHCREEESSDDTEAAGLITHAPLGVGPGLPGYEFLEVLGRGGMGAVYRARPVGQRREVAIKILHPHLAGLAPLVQRFTDEARLASSLAGAHILPVLQVHEANGVPAIVMPLVEGCDLGRILRDRRAVCRGETPSRPHPWAALDDRAYLGKVLPVLDQIVDAVTALHGAGVLHRDLKPANVLVDHTGSAWLTDFGLARFGDESHATTPGALFGTRGYASPEQAQGSEVDARTDVFGLGATLYEALTLELPFGKQGARGAEALPPAPTRRQPLLSRGFDAVLLKALEPRRERRYVSSGELAEDWRWVRQGLPPRHGHTRGATRRAARVLREQPLKAFRVACMLLVPAVLLAIGAWLVRPRDAGVMRSVRLVTEPPGARVVLVPLDENDGTPAEAMKIPAPGTTPTIVPRVPAGDYLVVAQIPGFGFHEVYRRVPKPGDNPLADGPARGWREDEGGAVELYRIWITPEARVMQGMTYFPGGEFTMGSDRPEAAMTPGGIPPHRRMVAPFYLDTTEVTVGPYRQRYPLDPEFADIKPTDDHAVRRVSFWRAADYAESQGKRLMDEAEYEFAATSGGRTRFPWGDDPPPERWPFAPVRTRAYDQTRTEPPVFGLFSNVAEWTSSLLVPYPAVSPGGAEDHAGNRLLFRGQRVIRGGAPGILQGRPDPTGQHKGEFWDPRCRFGAPPDGKYPGVGFRCARSAGPRFLSP
jgi:formylglycine-generating enzyme required for sulfatase activity